MGIFLAKMGEPPPLPPNNGKNDSDFSLPVPQTERQIIKVFRNLWYSIVDYRVPQMFF